MVPGGPGAEETEAQLLGRAARDDVEVVEDLDVITDESDRRDHHIPRAARLQGTQRVVEIRLQPRIRRVPAAAGVGQGPRAAAETLGGQARPALDALGV